jgi:hypothetical protein
MILAFLILIVLFSLVVDCMITPPSARPHFIMKFALLLATSALLVYHVFIR